MFDHPPLIFVWPDAAIFWSLMAWIYFVEGRQIQRKSAVSEGYSGSDKYSGLVISIGATVLQMLAVLFAYHQPTSVGEANLHTAYYAGLAMVACGTLLRMHCWKALGTFFTHTVTIASNHQVVNVGAYQWLRHPSYLGALLNLIGIGLLLGNYASLAIMTLGSCAIYLYRIEVEENALEAALGESYTRFKQTRKRLIPFVY
jgi:protein-S-isoprenylcysteine O-methyltransferase Ste14